MTNATTPRKPKRKSTVVAKGLIEIPLPPTHKLSLPPDTTAEEDITTAGQRRVNLIWEFTQATIAILITMAMIYSEIKNLDSVAIRMGFSLIVGFYFSRTNHQAIGGIGKKPGFDQYRGR